ncbi:hypothetical protein H6G89_16590 [Oscillatoria sp. FACHB-1407]|uniref:hypothetical protein n=1 Tax=Oscillatoria sp. FACHB-1407 TaxID=2692847 RepID=UPI001689E331|nr:hypothetical protein [Oscillatoria sp. FACHB-1407]MBD2462660.1 hypothetical protein [Oscillatoria sp. FACHB-1407]
MNSSSHQSVADQLLADLRYEGHLVDLIIRGCIELRWAIAHDEQEIARAMIYNAFETYVRERGMALSDAEQFCERHLEELIQKVFRALGE